MTKRTFSVTAVWDEDAQVYYAQSDIIGLHIEAATLEEFEQIMMEVAPALVVENHLSKPDLVTLPMADLIPAIVWNRPAEKTLAR